MQDNVAKKLIQLPITLTTSYQDIGGIVNYGDIEAVSIFLDFTINSSSDVQIRAQGYLDPQGTVAYDLPTSDVQTSSTNVTPNVIKLDASCGSKQIVSVSSVDLLPGVKLQIKVGTVGATAAVLNNCHIVGKNRS